MKSLTTTRTRNTACRHVALMGIASAVFMLFGPVAHAAGVPNTFSSGQTVSSSQMNANFTAVESDIANPTITGNITMPIANGTSGAILKNTGSTTVPFLHDYGPTGAASGNIFLGQNAGNFTMGGAGPQGTANTAVGTSTLAANTTGDSNTANGYQALMSNTTGSYNTASGLSALISNMTGGYNTAIGINALHNNMTGFFNIAVGYNAGFSSTGNHNIDIGNGGVVAESNTIRIGTPYSFGAGQTSAFIAGIYNVTTGSATGLPVIIDANGQLGTTLSARRYKDDITAMGDASDVLMKLRPVTFYYKTSHKLKVRPLQYGLVAEEVQKVAPQLVALDAKGEPEAVYYQFLAPMLLNEYQKQQHTIQAQAVQLKRQSAEIAEQRAQAKKARAELTEQKQRVTALEQQARELVALRQQVTHMSAVLARLDSSNKLTSTTP